MTSRPDMERIVIATDGSDSAREALHVGLELAAEQGTPVTIVHVVKPSDGGPARHAEDDEALREGLALARHEEIEPDLELLEGEPAEEVARLAEQIDADLVIIGSRGLGRASAAILGSVSRSMLDCCKQPVMVVRGRRTSD